MTPSPDTTETEALDAEDLSLSSLKPAQPRRSRKRIGRGMGSGKGRYCGRGIKGQKSRSGSHKMRPGFEGGQMPIHMRLPKQRGSTSKDAMPIGPHRTATQPVNVRDLERVFDDGAEVTLDAMVEKGLLKNLRTDVKLLGDGAVSKQLTVTVHRASASAKEKIAAAGGSVTEIKDAKRKKRRRRRSTAARSEPTAAEPLDTDAAPSDSPADVGDRVDASASASGEESASGDASASGEGSASGDAPAPGEAPESGDAAEAGE